MHVHAGSSASGTMRSEGRFSKSPALGICDRGDHARMVGPEFESLQWTEPAHALGMQHSKYDSPLGAIHTLASPSGLSAIYFPPQARRIEASLAPAGRLRGHGNIFLLRAEAYLACYFDGDLGYRPDIPLDLRGTPFQIEVWQALRAIPPGERITYRELATRLGRPEAVRAVASAIARNPVSILLPCHRVVGSDGSLRGYAGGLHAKRYLLEHEARHARESLETGGPHAIAA